MKVINGDMVHTILVDEMWDADDLPHNEQQAVLRACYSILERIEKRAPEVKAIPIEWFKKKINCHIETATYGAEVYQWVLNRWYEDKEDWEKENEK